MQNQGLRTFFDTPERHSVEENFIVKEKISENILLIQLIEAFPLIVVVLNMERQIVAFNKNAITAFKPFNENEIIGMRLGEALNCIHAHEEIAGCGTSIFCVECGAAKAIKFTKETSKPSINECRITKKNEHREISLDFRVASSCILIKGDRFILFTVTDIADEKRRNALERTFFHDVLNTATAVHGISELIPIIEDREELLKMGALLNSSAEQLISEIRSHRDLLDAETDNLSINITEVSVNRLLSKVADIYAGHQLARDKKIVVKNLPRDFNFYTDKVLLSRSLSNLVKNALEASGNGDIITLSGDILPGKVKFYVNNPAVIAKPVQLQIFQRSFSTKAKAGRGIGTYSVKLLVESYLLGQVSFTSCEGDGTTFCISLPYHVVLKTST